MIESMRTKSFASRHLAAYSVFLSTLNLSVNTCIAYKYQVSHFLSWLDDSDLADEWLAEPCMQERAIREYTRYLKKNKRAKQRTINAALTAIGSFYRFLGECGPITGARARMLQQYAQKAYLV